MDYNHPSPTSLALELFLVLSVMLRTLPSINVRARLESIAFPESLFLGELLIRKRELRGLSGSRVCIALYIRLRKCHKTVFELEWG